MLPTHSIRKPTPRKKTGSSFTSNETSGSNKKLFFLLIILALVIVSSFVYIRDLRSSFEVEKEVDRIQIRELQKIIQEKRSERADFQQALLDSRNALTEKEATLTSSRSQLSDCRSSFDELSQQQDITKSQIQSTREESEQLKSQIASLQKQIEESQQNLEATQSLLIDSQKRVDELVKQIQDLIIQREREDEEDQEEEDDQLFQSSQLNDVPDSNPNPESNVEPLDVTKEFRTPNPVDSEAEQHRQAVKEAMKFAWDKYKESAWGRDELMPLSNSSRSWFNLGLTIVDSIDTLFIMDMMEEYLEARDWIEKDMDFDWMNQSSTFEITIRELGGLLAIHTLTNDQMFLDRAETLGNIILEAFNTSSGFPHKGVLSPRKKRDDLYQREMGLSEVGSVQLEMLYLAYLTGNSEFAAKPLDLFKRLREMKPEDSLYPSLVDPKTGTLYGSTYTLGALSDSFYEYQLKLWLLTNKQYDGYRVMYEECSNALIENLVRKTASGLTFVDEISGNNYTNTMEHLTCFAGGMFALGSAEGAVSNRQEQMEVGVEITRTCWVMYDSMPTGTGVEIFQFDELGMPQARPTSSHYILRPEVVESLFVMWRLTHDQKYRDWGWEIFQAINTHCRTPGGFAGIQDVTKVPLEHNDLQQSFFTAETLKYLYLLFSPDDLIPLSEFVFNTEAHPFRIISETSSSMPRDLHQHLMLF